MGQLYFARISGRVIGPFSVQQLMNMRDSGKLKSWHEVSDDRRVWVNASSLKELFPSVEPPQTEAPQGDVADGSIIQSPTTTNVAPAVSAGGPDVAEASVPGTLMAAAALLLAYGGILLFGACTSLTMAFVGVAGADRDSLHVPGSRAAMGIYVVGGSVQFLISAAMLAAGVMVFGCRPVGRVAGYSALAAQFVYMLAVTALILVYALAAEDFLQGAGQGLIAIYCSCMFVPYFLWLAFTIPTAVMLMSPSATRAFAARTFLGPRLPAYNPFENN